MLSFLTMLFKTIESIAYASIYLSYNTGKLIVTGILSIYDVLNKIFATLWTVLVILNEDLLVFLLDVWNRLSELLSAFNNLGVYISDLVFVFIYGVKNIIYATSDMLFNTFYVITDIITKTFTGLSLLFAGIKHLVVLFGSGVWFVITIIPVFIIYTCVMISYYIGRAFQELQSLLTTSVEKIFTGLHDLIYFFIDVPFEAIAGLFVSICLIYAIIKFHVALYSSVSQIIKNLFIIINRKINQLRSIRFTRRNRTINQVNTPYTETDTSESDSSFDSDDTRNTEESIGPIPNGKFISNVQGWMTKFEGYHRIKIAEENTKCIICTERSKCMLFMPCRHMSTCKECTATLQQYQHNNCPICRRFIASIIHVY